MTSSLDYPPEVRQLPSVGEGTVPESQTDYTHNLFFVPPSLVPSL